MCREKFDNVVRLFTNNRYALYVLLLLTFTYLLNQLDRYLLAVVTKPMAQEIHYGDIACMANTSFTVSDLDGMTCNGTSNISCLDISNNKGEAVCVWDYNGQGYDYELLAGPVFTVIFTLCGIPLGFAADTFNRKNLLAGCLIVWSTCTILSGAVQAFWQVAVLRMILGAAESGCVPCAASLIADYFTEDLRGTAVSLFNWGIYFGYSLAYAVGNFITGLDILGQGWRWAWYLSGGPGIVVGVVMFFTAKEPERCSAKPTDPGPPTDDDVAVIRPSTVIQRLWLVLKSFCSPPVLLLCLAGSIRNAAGYVWAYNTQIFFESVGQTPAQVGTWMSWIPLVGGSLGVLLGGFISDRVVKQRGLPARLLVVIVSQLLAAPFAAGALWLSAPLCYISLIPANIIGEMWIGVTLAVFLELIPSTVRTSAVAVYLFIITNIGGNIPLLVPPLQRAFQSTGTTAVEGLRYALLILYPGEYVIGAVLFIVTLFVVKLYNTKEMMSKYEQLTEEINNEDHGD